MDNGFIKKIWISGATLLAGFTMTCMTTTGAEPQMMQDQASMVIDTEASSSPVLH
jgi:hypothetical protein